MFISVFVMFSVYSFVLLPLNIKVYTDVSFMIPVLTDILPFTLYLTDIAGLLVMYAFILFAAYRFGIGTVRTYTMFFVLLTLYEYLTSLAMIYVMDGTFPDTSDLLFDLMYRVAIPALYVYALLAVILLILYFVFRKVNAFLKSKETTAVKNPGASFDKNLVFYPFRKLFNLQNPLQRSAFFISIVFTVNKIVSQIITDIQIGAPTDTADLLWMVAAYISAFILGLAVYLFIIFILIQLNNRDIRMKHES